MAILKVVEGAQQGANEPMIKLEGEDKQITLTEYLKQIVTEVNLNTQAARPA